MWLLDCVVIFVGVISVLIISVMPIYLISKHKTISALAFWEYATKKEYKIIKIGYLGFIIAFLLAIFSAYIQNL
jgi:hypothetical protein